MHAATRHRRRYRRASVTVPRDPSETARVERPGRATTTPSPRSWTPASSRRSAPCSPSSATSRTPATPRRRSSSRPAEPTPAARRDPLPGLVRADRGQHRAFVDARAPAPDRARDPGERAARRGRYPRVGRRRPRGPHRRPRPPRACAGPLSGVPATSTASSGSHPRSCTDGSTRRLRSGPAPASGREPDPVLGDVDRRPVLRGRLEDAQRPVLGLGDGVAAMLVLNVPQQPVPQEAMTGSSARTLPSASSTCDPERASKTLAMPPIASGLPAAAPHAGRSTKIAGRMPWSW